MTHHTSDVEPDSSRHASVKVYSLIALILFVITMVEVSVLYEPLNSTWASFRIGLLVTLSVLKFIAVVAFFMHLFYDSPLCTSLFCIGLVLAALTMTALVHLFKGSQYRKASLTPTHKVSYRLKQIAASNALPPSINPNLNPNQYQTPITKPS